MRKKIFSLILSFVMLIVFVPIATIAYTGTQYGDYLYYEINDDGTEVTITDCDESASKVIEIPAQIDGLPVVSIGDFAFSGCSGLTSIAIPDSVQNIGIKAFYNCSRLKNINIPNGITDIKAGTFYDCTALTAITIPDDVTSIGISAFYDCGSLTSIIIPDSVASVGSYAFWCCENLKNVMIGNGVTSIGNSTFYGCGSLTSVTIGNSVTSIGQDAFYECRNLINITIPDSVTSIGRNAFWYCDSLQSITIGNGVKSIGSFAFGCCSDLENVYITDLAAWMNIDFDNEYKCATPMHYAQNMYINGELAENVIIPEGTTEIKEYAFYGWNCLQTVTIPDSVLEIGNYAFSEVNVSTVYYNGTQDDWDYIDFGLGNNSLKNATVLFDSDASGEVATSTPAATVIRKVLIAWENDNSDSRPASISVTLLCNGEACDTVTLKSSDNWRYTWKELDATCDWDLVETDVPDGYEVSIVLEGGTFVVTNTYTAPTPTLTPAPETEPTATPEATSTPDSTPVVTLAPGNKGGGSSKATPTPTPIFTTDSPLSTPRRATPAATVEPGDYPYTVTALSVEDQTGAALSEAPTGKSFIVNAEIVENTARSDRDYLIVAVYGTDGALLSINYMKCDFITGEPLNIGLNIQPQTAEIGTIKASVWDSLESMTPLAVSKEL